MKQTHYDPTDSQNHMGVSATSALDRTDFKMSGYQGMVGNNVTLTIDAELVQAAATGAR